MTNVLFIASSCWICIVATISSKLKSDLILLSESEFSFQWDQERSILTDKWHSYAFIPETNDIATLLSHSHSKSIFSADVRPITHPVAKHYVVTVFTSEKNLADKHSVKVVLRGEHGLTKIIPLHHSSWNSIPWQARHKDKFLLLAPDVGKVGAECRCFARRKTCLDIGTNLVSCQ